MWEKETESEHHSLSLRNILTLSLSPTLTLSRTLTLTLSLSLSLFCPFISASRHFSPILPGCKHSAGYQFQGTHQYTRKHISILSRALCHTHTNIVRIICVSSLLMVLINTLQGTHQYTICVSSCIDEYLEI